MDSTHPATPRPDGGTADVDHDAEDTVGLAVQFARLAADHRSAPEGNPSEALSELAARIIGADDVTLTIGAAEPTPGDETPTDEGADPTQVGTTPASRMAHRLEVNGQNLGLLEITSSRPGAFGTREVELGEIIAAHAAMALYSASQEQRAEHLGRALQSNRRIGIAIGIVMHARRLSEADALQVLLRHSQSSNRKLADIAEDVAYTGQAPE